MTIVDNQGISFQVAPPFSIEFDCERKNLATASNATFRIFNLSKNTRNRIRRDQWTNAVNQKITFTAGYGKNIQTIFNGTIHQAWSVRQGTSFITEITAYDSGLVYLDAQCNLPTVPKGTPYKAIVTQLIQSMVQYGISLGYIGQIVDVSGATSCPREMSFSGNTIAAIKSLVGDQGFFIDNGVANVLQDNEIIPGYIPVLNASTGLIGTPVREVLTLHFDILFEPSLYIGQIVQVDSSTGDSDTNKQWKVATIHHRGMISESVCGEAKTTIGIYAGPQFIPAQKG